MSAYAPTSQAPTAAPSARQSRPTKRPRQVPQGLDVGHAEQVGALGATNGPLPNDDNPALMRAKRAAQAVREQSGTVERIEALLDPDLFGNVTDGDAVEALSLLDGMMLPTRMTVMASLKSGSVERLSEELPDDEGHPYRTLHPGATIALAVHLGTMEPLHWYMRQRPEAVGLTLHHDLEVGLLLETLPEGDLELYAQSQPESFGAWTERLPARHPARKRVNAIAQRGAKAAGVAKVEAQRRARAKAGAAGRVAADKDLLAACESVEDLLSYGAFDWEITDAEARKALKLLSDIADTASREAVVIQLEARGLNLDRLADNLSEGDRQANLPAFLSVMALRDPARNVAMLEDLLSGDILGDMSESDARLVMQMMHALPQAEQLRLRTMQDGEFWAEMTSELSQEATRDQTTGFAGQSKDREPLKAMFAAQAGKWPEDRVAAVARMLRAMGEGEFVTRTAAELGVSVPQVVEVETQEAGTLVGGGLRLLAAGAVTSDEGALDLADVLAVSGMAEEFQLAKLGDDEAQAEGVNELHFKKSKDRLVARIPAMALAGVHMLSGTTKLETGPLVAQGLVLDLKWPSGTSPEAWFKLSLGSLMTDHLMQTTPQGALNLGKCRLDNFNLAAEQPKSANRPDEMADQVSYAMGVLQDLIPGFAHLIEAASKAASDPAATGAAMGEAFPAMTNADITLGGFSVDGVDTSDGGHIDGVAMNGLAVMVRNRLKDELLLEQMEELQRRVAGPTVNDFMRRKLGAQLAQLDLQWRRAGEMRQRLDALEAKKDEDMVAAERAEMHALRKALTVQTTRAGFNELSVTGVDMGGVQAELASIRGLRATATIHQDAAGKSHVQASIEASVQATGIVKGAGKTRYDQRLAALESLRAKPEKTAEEEVRLEDLEASFGSTIALWDERQTLRSELESGGGSPPSPDSKARLKVLDEQLAVWDQACPDLKVGQLQGRMLADVANGEASAALIGAVASDVQMGETKAKRVSADQLGVAADGLGGAIGQASANVRGLHAEGLESGVKGQEGYVAAGSAHLASLDANFDGEMLGGRVHAELKGLKLEDIERQSASMAQALDRKVRVLVKTQERLGEDAISEAKSEEAQKVATKLKRALRQQKRYDKLKRRAAKAKTRQGRRWWRKKLAKWNAATVLTIEQITAEDASITAIKGGRDLRTFDPNFVGVNTRGRVNAKGIKRNGMSVEEAYADQVSGGFSMDGSGQYSLSAKELGVTNARDKGNYRLRKGRLKEATFAGANEGPTTVEAGEFFGKGYRANGVAAGGFGGSNLRAQLGAGGTISGTAQHAWIRDGRMHGKTKARVRNGAVSGASFRAGPNSNSFGARRIKATGIDVAHGKGATPDLRVGADTFESDNVSFGQKKWGTQAMSANMGETTLSGVVGGVPDAEGGPGTHFAAGEVGFEKLAYKAHKDRATKTDHSRLEVGGLAVTDGMAFGDWGQAGADHIGAQSLVHQAKTPEGQAGTASYDVHGAAITNGSGIIGLPDGETLAVGTGSTTVGYARVAQGPDRLSAEANDVKTDASALVTDRYGMPQKRFNADLKGDGLFYKQAGGITKAGLGRLKGHVSYDGDPVNPLMKLPNGERIHGGGGNIDLKNVNYEANAATGAKALSYGHIKGKNLHITKFDGAEQTILKSLSLGRKGKLSNIAIGADGLVSGDLYELRVVTAKGVELPLDVLNKLTVDAGAKIGHVQLRKVNPADLAAAGSVIRLDDIRVFDSEIGINGTRGYIDQFGIGELVSKGLGDGKVQVSGDWARLKGRLGGDVVNGSVKSDLTDFGATLRLGDSPTVLSGWLSKMKNDVKLEVSIDPDDSQKSEKAEGVKLVLDVLRNAEGSLYAQHLTPSLDNVPYIGGLLQDRSLTDGEVLMPIEKGIAKGTKARGSARALGGPRVAIGAFLRSRIADRDIPGLLEEAVRDTGGSRSKPLLSPSALRKLHASLVLNKMSGTVSASDSSMKARGYVSSGTAQLGKRPGEGFEAKAQQLRVDRVRVQALNKLLTVRQVKLPKLSISLTPPGEAVKVRIRIDNNTISDLQLKEKN